MPDLLQAAGAGELFGQAEITGADQLIGLPGGEDRQAVGAVKALISQQIGAAALGKTRTLTKQIPVWGPVELNAVLLRKSRIRPFLPLFLVK